MHLHLVFNCSLSFRASSKVLSSFLLVGAGLISWVPHFTTGIGWALRVGLYCLRQAQCHLGFDHGVGHSLLVLCDAKAPHGNKWNDFKALENYLFIVSISLS